MSTITEDKFGIRKVLEQLGIGDANLGASTGSNWIATEGEEIISSSPVDGAVIGVVTAATESDYNQLVEVAQEGFKQWRTWPAPQRGEVVRQLGERLRHYKEPLGKLVSYEMGKSYQEGLGEVQEMIDICDFAVGLSRQLYGLTMHSERPGHRMYEQYHPLGVVGII
ncbi:MAG: aldehyde dehydrogenase family protein, partial [Cyclobacteriaceae bacterium]|nr:aldehyde dehydrogenase family protein [Cyclobacteriaceae bacterium]